MLSKNLLIHKLKSEYSQFVFEKSNTFSWSHKNQTIYYDNNSNNFELFILHELSHALLNHNIYIYDIELISMEQKAWNKVSDIAQKFNIKIDDNIVQDTLDTYRDWLHSRSTCTECQATGIQTNYQQYKCPVCKNEWKVNEARLCALRRYKIKK